MAMGAAISAHSTSNVVPCHAFAGCRDPAEAN
jgi:hypothetical protein